MSRPAHAPAFLEKFSCLGAECEDTCCRGWSMQLDETTWQKYETSAPELCGAVMEEEGAGRVMRRDPNSGYCVKLEQGLCSIHRDYGTKMLGDACYFYPRIARTLGDETVMTAALSCPEVARLALLGDESLTATASFTPERLPHTVKDYLPEGMAPSDALAVHHAFIAAAEENVPSARILARISSVARSFEMMTPSVWAQAAPIYLQLADARLPSPKAVAEDPFNLLHALAGLIVASRKKPSERLEKIISQMELKLACSLDWQQVQIHTTSESMDSYQAMVAAWNEKHAAIFEPYLRRWIAVQLLTTFFPFSGASTLSQRVSLIGMRYAILVLALQSTVDIIPSMSAQEVLVFCAQSLARFLDHLGDPAFTLSICEETGWLKEERMLGLLGFH